MLTTDLALRVDPIYEAISKRFHENPKSSPTRSRRRVQVDAPRHGAAFALPRPVVPNEHELWQDPIPDVTHELIGTREIAELKATLLGQA